MVIDEILLMDDESVAVEELDSWMFEETLLQLSCTPLNCSELTQVDFVEGNEDDPPGSPCCCADDVEP